MTQSTTDLQSDYWLPPGMTYHDHHMDGDCPKRISERLWIYFDGRLRIHIDLDLQNGRPGNDAYVSLAIIGVGNDDDRRFDAASRLCADSATYVGSFSAIGDISALDIALDWAQHHIDEHLARPRTEWTAAACIDRWTAANGDHDLAG